MYLHCPRCQTTVSAARLSSANPVCPRCGEPAAEPLSFFSTMPSRFLRRGGGGRPPATARPSPGGTRDQSTTLRLMHR